MSRCLATIATLAVLTLLRTVAAQTTAPTDFQNLFEAIQARPEYRHSVFGAAIYSLDKHKLLFAANANKLFVSASTTKLVTSGTALHLLGPNFRFHTPVYRTGELTRTGEIKGDLVLVASGDPTLSGRLQPDGSLAFADEDHSYGGPDARLIGDSMAALDVIAAQIVASGVHKVSGHIRVDVSLFPEGDREAGTGVTVSPIIVNDNLLDIVVTPGPRAGAPATLAISPQVPYIHIVNRMTTGAPHSLYASDRTVVTAVDGDLTVTLSGSIAADSHAAVDAYPVPEPSHFAAVLLTQALERRGIHVVHPDFLAISSAASPRRFYTSANKITEYISAPLSEEIKVILKTSQNLHAHSLPLILGATVGHATVKIDAAGFDLEHKFLSEAGLDLSGAAQADGEGGNAFFTPDFMVHYLAYMATQKEFLVFRAALPILGQDGTLFDIQTTSVAAGHVFAKTGTDGANNLLNRDLILTAKGLAGYTTTPSGEHLAFALYVNNIPLSNDPEDATKYPGQALGELAAAIYLLPTAPSTGGGG